MLQFQTTGFNGYAVKYSPYIDSRIAVGAAQNFGLVGNGRVYVLELTSQGILCPKFYDTQDAVYDIAWSEANENQLLAACGDGTVKLFDVNVAHQPIAQWSEHSREVYSVFWNQVTKDNFVTSSWDGTLKLYNPERAQSLLTLPTHSCTYSTEFSPHSPSIISAVTSDSHIRIFDIRIPASAANHLVHLIPIHGPAPTLANINTRANPLGPRPPPSECLTHDWNKYRGTILATAGVDQIIRTFDLRAPRAGAVTLMSGHRYAVRRISWSPHNSDLLLSGSYDMSVKLWSDGNAMSDASMVTPNLGRELGEMGAHTEFVTGVDWCLFGSQGWVASTAWDQRLLVWDARTIIT
ncbi:hypothetical protein HYALB_00007562 [Hymenoscyphus albidus]|uniref:Peroxin-7 n=1 Tax=Hymenoscyphus albidus TaxID=595503 RepID=A0A9N9Q1F6_9HELO|nr:hypothetical protein HYALB_00007562 [Hymenoscyphus albidus]